MICHETHVCSSLSEDSTSLSSQYMYVLLNCHRAEDFSWMKVWTRVNSSFYCRMWFLCRYNKCVIEFEVSIIICDLHSFLLWIGCKFRINFVLIRELILVLVVSLVHESLQMILVSFLSLWLPICSSVCCCFNLSLCWNQIRIVSYIRHDSILDYMLDFFIILIRL